MTDPSPSIVVTADPRNPGQFFACCGLLELADRLWPEGAEGWFAGREFCIDCGGPLSELLQRLIARKADEVKPLPNGIDVKSLVAPLRLTLDPESYHTLTLDAWLSVRIEKGEVIATGNPPWNFWSGQQTSSKIWNGLRDQLAAQLKRLTPQQLDRLFDQRLFQGGRFGFDPGPAWTPLDVGFSPNEQSIEVESSPAVELLAAVGIQRFRPVMADNRESFVYATWGGPLGPVVAAAAASGALIVPPSTRFRGRVVSRGQYAALGSSTPLRGDADE